MSILSSIRGIASKVISSGRTKKATPPSSQPPSNPIPVYSGPVQQGVNEIYNRNLNAFVSPSPTGYGSTGFVRPPTPEEQYQIDLQNNIPTKITRGIRNVEASLVPALTLDKTTYLPDKSSYDKYEKLLDKTKYGALGGDSGKKLSEFLDKQQEKLSTDLEYARAYNKIVEQTGTAPSSFYYGDKKIDTDAPFRRLQAGSMGQETFPSGWDILKRGSDIAERSGQKVKLFGFKTSPTFARSALKAGTSAYNVEKAVLGYELGGAALGSLGVLPAVTGSATALRVLKGIQIGSSFVLGGSLATAGGVTEFSQSRDLPYSIGAGVGTGLGFFGGVYSKEIFESPSKVIKFVEKNINQIPKLSQSKSGQLFPQQSQYADEVVEVVYNGKRVKMTLSEARRLGLQPMSRTQAVGEFGRASKDRQINIIKKAFKADSEGNLRVYFDQQSLEKDILQATRFMKEAGLKNARIKEILTEVFPQLFKVSTPIATSSGAVKEDLSPLIVGGKGGQATESIYAGLGKYEVPEQMFTSSVKGKLFPLISDLEQPVVSTKMDMSYSLVDLGKQDIGSLSLNIPIVTSPSVSRSSSSFKIPVLSIFKTPQQEKLKQPQRSKLVQPLSTLLVSKSKYKQVPLLKIEQVGKQRETTTTRTEEKINDPLEIGIPRLSFKKKKKKVSGRERFTGEQFLAITRRRGKEVILGKFKTPKKAAQVARRNVLGTLGATAKVRTTKGRQIQLSPDKLFRPSKRDPLAIVQRQTGRGRIASLGEKREIKSSRRRPFSLL